MQPKSSAKTLKIKDTQASNLLWPFDAIPTKQTVSTATTVSTFPQETPTDLIHLLESPFLDRENCEEVDWQRGKHRVD
jgi:hypothetical protein